MVNWLVNKSVKSGEMVGYALRFIRDFEVLMAVSTKITVFWNVKQWSKDFIFYFF